MNRNFTAWVSLGFLVLFAALTLWLDRIVQPPAPKLDGSTRHDPDYIVENFNSVKLDLNGQPEMTLAAVKMLHYPDDRTTHLTRPHFIRTSLDQPTLHIYAQRGIITEDGEHAYLHDQVRVVREARGNLSELTLTTSFLHVLPDAGLATTDKPVEIRDAHTHITAVGLKLNQKTHKINLLSRVRVQYASPHR